MTFFGIFGIIERGLELGAEIPMAAVVARTEPSLRKPSGAARSALASCLTMSAFGGGLIVENFLDGGLIHKKMWKCG